MTERALRVLWEAEGRSFTEDVLIRRLDYLQLADREENQGITKPHEANSSKSLKCL